jgi:protein SCO1/2
VYNLSSAWRDSRGKQVRLSSPHGSVVVMAMIYASCEGACPLTVTDMKRIERELPESLRAKVRFVLVSFDAVRDSPAVLARYAVARNLPAPRWTLLTGDDDGVRDLAAVLGMHYRATPSGDFVHSNLITVLDGDGAVVARQGGLQQDPGATLAAVRDAAR